MAGTLKQVNYSPKSLFWTPALKKSDKILRMIATLLQTIYLRQCVSASVRQCVSASVRQCVAGCIFQQKTAAIIVLRAANVRRDNTPHIIH
jgi:electron transfer flavoprotein alpha subunit